MTQENFIELKIPQKYIPSIIRGVQELKFREAQPVLAIIKEELSRNIAEEENKNVPEPAAEPEKEG